QRAVFDLLKQVGDAIRGMDLYEASLLVNRGFISGDTESLPGLNQIEQHGVLGLRPDVEVAGIEPASDVQAWNMFAWLVGRVGCGALSIQIKMLVVHRRLQRIIQMADAVPDAVSLSNQHVVHLNGEEHVEGWVPGLLVDARIDSKWMCPHITILDHVQTGFSYRRKIERSIIVSQVFAPAAGLARVMLDQFAITANLWQARGSQRLIVLVELDDRNFLLIGMVAD